MRRDGGGSSNCISIVGISLTKRQSGSAPVYNSPDSRAPPEKTRLGPSAYRYFAAAGEIAVTGRKRRHSAMAIIILSIFIIIA